MTETRQVVADLAEAQQHLSQLLLAEARDPQAIAEAADRVSRRERLPHGDWLPWLEAEFGWTDRTALNFVRAYELCSKSEMISDLNIDARSLYALAAPSTPPAAVEAVAEAVDRVRRLERWAEAAANPATCRI